MLILSVISLVYRQFIENPFVSLVLRGMQAGVAAVITEPQYPARAGRTLAAETGIPCITLDPAANGPDNIASPLEWYENIMRGNIRTLEQALGTR